MSFPVGKAEKPSSIRREGEFEAAERFFPQVCKKAKEKLGAKNQMCLTL